MKKALVVARKAESDLDEQSEYLGRDDRLLARRFLDSANAAFAELLATPGLGRVREFRAARLRGFRSWRIRGFENWLVFYRVTEAAIEVVRVLHGARDVDAVLNENGNV